MAIPTRRRPLPCNVLNKKHDWRERPVRYSPYSTQSVGTSWKCSVCGAESDEKLNDY